MTAEQEEKKKKEEEKTSIEATVLFVDCHRMPFSGHYWLTKIDSCTFDLLTKRKRLSKKNLQDKDRSKTEIKPIH